MSTPPGAPNIEIRPRAAAGSISFWWSAPTPNGGPAVTKYTLACSSISYTQDLSPTVFNYTVTGLTNGVEHVFTLTATNADGTGPAATFRSVQPGVRPFGPSQVTVSTLNASTAVITWNLSTIANEGASKWFVIKTFPSTPTLSTTRVGAYAADRSINLAVPSTNIYYQFLVQSLNDTGYCAPFAYTSTLLFGSAQIVTSGLQIRYDATTYSGSGAWTNTGALGSGYNATVESGTPSKNGAGNGVVLDGSTNFTFPDISLGNSWSAAVWVKPTSLPVSSAAAWVTQLGTGGPINLMIYGNFAVVGGNAGASQISGGFYDGSSFTNPTAVDVSTNVWYHLTYTWDGTTIRLYVSGASTASDATGRTATSSGQVYRIGRSYDGGSTSYITGEIGQVLIYNRAITGAEALQNYNATSATFSA